MRLNLLLDRSLTLWADKPTKLQLVTVSFMVSVVGKMKVGQVNYRKGARHIKWSDNSRLPTTQEYFSLRTTTGTFHSNVWSSLKSSWFAALKNDWNPIKFMDEINVKSLRISLRQPVHFRLISKYRTLCSFGLQTKVFLNIVCKHRYWCYFACGVFRTRIQPLEWKFRCRRKSDRSHWNDVKSLRPHPFGWEFHYKDWMHWI